jgi:choline dehydrogenase
MTTPGHRVDARNPVIAILNSTNPDGSKNNPLALSTQFFVTEILFNATGVNSRTPRATAVEFLAGKSMFSVDPRFNGSVKGTKMLAFASKEVIHYLWRRLQLAPASRAQRHRSKS